MAAKEEPWYTEALMRTAEKSALDIARAYLNAANNARTRATLDDTIVELSRVFQIKIESERTAALEDVQTLIEQNDSLIECVNGVQAQLTMAGLDLATERMKCRDLEARLAKVNES